MSRISYRPEVDGLRGVAVLAVVLYHAGLGFTGGFVGVDVFFVISGYLIMSILKKELEETGRISIVEFWTRRVRRLFPALFVCVLLTSLAGACLLLPRHFQTLGQAAAAQSFFGSNVYFWLKSGYFEPGSETKPLLHTWSLSIEEQFYVVLPLLLLPFRRNRVGMVWSLA